MFRQSVKWISRNNSRARMLNESQDERVASFSACAKFGLTRA
jgi:hypothetical protein